MMFRRPKPGETEEDLLKFQRQFLAEKPTPSVSVTKKPGDKRAADRDVVQLDERPATVSTTNPAPVAKKSKFRAAQELKAKAKLERNQAPLSHHGDIIDEHDASTATVLSKIIERDTRNVAHCLPNRVDLSFPLVSGSKVQTPGNKKQSLFAQHFAKAPEKFTAAQNDIPSAVKVGINMETDDDQDCLPSIIDGSGLSATLGKNEIKKIHEENIHQLAEMSEEEILSEQQRFLEMLDPEVIKFVKERHSKNINNMTKSQNESEITTVKLPVPIEKKKHEVEVDVPVDVKKDWVHMDQVEYDKLEWMKDLPPPETEVVKSGQTARFDFQGNLIQPDVDIPVNMGLHHHGDEPERAGYTLEELFILARSTNTQQKVIALTTLSKIIKQAKEGNLSSLIQSPILPCVIDAGVIFLLRWSLDDSVESVMVSAIAALNALLVNHADEKALNKVFHWYQGHRIACQAPSVPESVGIKLPGEADEKSDPTDAEVTKQDLILALGSRMNLIQRLGYILDKVRPQAPTVIGILQILTKMCRHSRKMAYEVLKCSRLVDIVITQFVPASWKLSVMAKPVSDVYGVPLTEAMTLICTMCQAGRNMAAILLTKYQVEERLIRFLITDVNDMGLPETEAHGLQIACYNTWKVCLAYGLADNVYIEIYPKIVEKLRASFDVEQDFCTVDRLSALVSCLEMAVHVATTPRKQHGFNQNDDNAAIGGMKEEPVLPDINWSHVADLIQPVRLLLQKSLSLIAQSYQIKKQSLQLPIACMNFITTYYIHSQSQLQGEDVVNSLQDMECIYKETLQHWNCIGFQYLLSSLSRHSNIISHNLVKNLEQSGCLPEYSNSSLLEEHFVPTVSKDSPVGFLSAFYRLIYQFSKIHPGLKMSASEPGLSPHIVLQSPDLKTYFEKSVTGKLSHVASSMFTRFETHMIYYILKLAADMAVVKKGVLDMTLLHRLSLKMLSILQHGDEYIAHDLLSTVVFNPVFFRSQSTESTMMKLEGLNLSLPTHIQSATCEEMEIVSEKLIAEAQDNLFAIRAAYLASMSHNEQFVMFSRNHYLGVTSATNSCFTSNIEEFLMPQDWIFSPLIELYNTFLSVGADVQNVLSNSQLDVVRSVLRWIYVIETCQPVMLGGVSVTLRLSRIMCTFLTGNEMFLDHAVHCYLAGLLRTYTHPSLLRQINFSEDIPGLPSFYDLYVSLVQQFEAVSFGDTVFACYLLLPLQQRCDVKFRRSIWTEYTGILRTLSLPLNQLMLPLELYLEPEETNIELLRLYYQSLYSGKLRPKWSPLLYLVAVHHVNRFVYTKGKTHQKLKSAMMQQMLQCKNEEVKQHIIHYMKADISKPFGMILYETLPDIRQSFINTFANSATSSV